MIKVKKGDLVHQIDEKDLAEFEASGYEKVEAKKGKKNDQLDFNGYNSLRLRAIKQSKPGEL